jgi:hypothetical protein
MPIDEIRRRSRWMIRALEWDDPRARYPNLWHEGMPRHLLAFDTVAMRLRLGDLVAVYYPASQRYPDRSERFVGIARVAGLRRSDAPGFAWVDLETAWKFDPPLDLGEAPRRVFLCCDPGWPARDFALFERVLAAAIDGGFRPAAEEAAEVASPSAPSFREEGAEEVTETLLAEPSPTLPPAEAPAPTQAPRQAAARLFAGADYSGDMRDPRSATWLAVLAQQGDRLEVVRLDATGRSGLQGKLRDGDTEFLHVEAVGLDFPFGLPVPFAEALLGGPLPEDGWWALARRVERMTRPEFLVAIQEFRDAHGEAKRLTDEVAGAFSPLHRVNPDLGPMTYHGIKMLVEERSRYALRPFERAKGRLLLEVYPGGLARKLDLRERVGGERHQAILDALERLDPLPVTMADRWREACLQRRDALDAVLAARCAAWAVLEAETDRTAEELAPGEGAKVLLEGWIYGLA